jgi:predicted dehydrogenase
MKGRVRWGIVGSGGIAKRRTIPEGFATARNAATNNEVARQSGALACESLEALLAADIDAVYVASPVIAHVEQVVACAKAGKHVLCEKPLGRTVSEAEQIVNACKTAGVQCGTAFMMRFHSQHKAAAKLIEEGRLGKPVYARAQLSCWYPPMEHAWRHDPALAGGGSLIDMGSHCIDLLEMFFGPVARVSCLVNNTIHSYKSEDSAVALLQFAKGALGTVDAFFCIQDDASKNVLELYGSKGSILARGTIGQGSAGEMKAYLLPEDTAYQSQQTRSEAGALTIAPEPENIYRAEVEAFSQALLDKAPNPMDGQIGLRNQKLIAACYESAKTGRAIAV